MKMFKCDIDSNDSIHITKIVDGCLVKKGIVLTDSIIKQIPSISMSDIIDMEETITEVEINIFGHIRYDVKCYAIITIFDNLFKIRTNIDMKLKESTKTIVAYSGSNISKFSEDFYSLDKCNRIIENFYRLKDLASETQIYY